MPNDPQLHLEDVSWKYTGELKTVFNTEAHRINNLLVVEHKAALLFVQHTLDSKHFSYNSAL